MKSATFPSVFSFIMEVRALRCTRGLMFVVVLSLLKQTAEGFAGSPLVAKTYLSTGTEDSEQSSDPPTSPRAAISAGTASFGYSSTSETSDLHPSFSERESHTATDQNPITDVTESWTEQNRSDVATESPNSSPAFNTNTVSEWEDPSTIANNTDAYTVAEEWQPASEYRTVRDLTVTKLAEQKHTDLDTTESGSNTDSTYISSTLSRAGERALLSITSNSTFPYGQDTSSSSLETASNTVTGQEEETGVSQHTEYTKNVSFTESDQSDATFENFPTNATQKDVFETEGSYSSQVTQSHTGQPTVTGSDFESTSKTSNPRSTPPLTIINSTDSETDTTDETFTNQSLYTDSSSSSSIAPPFVLTDDTHTSVSHQDGKTTETPTSPVSTSTGEKPDEPKTFMEETTISGLTTAPSTIWDKTTSEHESSSTQQTFVTRTDSSSEPTEVLSTAPGHSTDQPPLTTTTMPASKGTTAPLTPHEFQASTTAEAQSTPHSTVSAMETTQKTTPTTAQHHPTTAASTPSLSDSSSQSGAGATDLSTLHFETSTATPGSTKAHSQHTTASYNTSTPTMSTVVITTGNHTETEATTTQMTVKLSPTPDHMCSIGRCANGGTCVNTSGGYRCECLPAWKGENCTEDMDECVSNPCPQVSECVNTMGSFRCECTLGYDLQDGQNCTKTKTFLGILSVNSSLEDSHREILQLLNASLSNLPGYRRSALRYLDRFHVFAVNMFSTSADVTCIDIYSRIQASLRNCSKPQSCSLKLLYQLTFQMESLCQKNKCDPQYAVCNGTDGSPYCQCHEGNVTKNPEEGTQRDCGDGLQRENGTCIKCPFGFGGLNCSNFNVHELIATVGFPAAFGLLIIFIIALIVTCCRKDKNDINKIIFKSGDLQMSPYGEFPKSSRVSMEWGRETIEMQENGSTKNLLQMTDIYYSPALRNADLERNGLYPFSGLPGSRHSCIYPAQWNPSFISDDSRRRDYF